MASAASNDLFESWPERAQRMQSQASGPSSCWIGETVCPDDSERQGLAASRSTCQVMRLRYIDMSTVLLGVVSLHVPVGVIP